MPREPITDLSVYKDKEASPAQEHFANWIIEKVGMTFATKTSETAFREGVRLAKVLIMRHQASDEAKEFTAELKADRERERATAAPVPAATPAAAPAKPAKPAKAAAAPAETAPAAPAKPPTTRGRRGAAAAPKVDAPF